MSNQPFQPAPQAPPQAQQSQQAQPPQQAQPQPQPQQQQQQQPQQSQQAQPPQQPPQPAAHPGYHGATPATASGYIRPGDAPPNAPPPGYEQHDFARPGDSSRSHAALMADALESSGFAPEDIREILGESGTRNAYAAAAAATDPQQEREELERIAAGAAALSARRSRAQADAISKAMRRPGNPFFLPTCPSGDSSELCPLYRAFGFRVHYHWANGHDREVFGLLLSGGLGMPLYHVVQGQADIATLRNPAIAREEKHLAAVEATKQIAHQLGKAADVVVDTATNRIRIGQNVLVYCRLSDFQEWWNEQRRNDQQIRKGAIESYVASIEESPARRHIKPFVKQLGQLADEKAFATRDDRPFSGQVGGSRRQPF